MPRGYEKLWPFCKVRHLVLSTDQFIVFIDDSLDIDWSTSKAYDEKGHQDAKQHNAIMNAAALLESTPCEGISTAITINFKRLVGEAIARSLDHDYAGAQKMLDHATTYINARSQETSRLWYLSASTSMTVPFIIVGMAFWLYRTPLVLILDEAPFWLFLCSMAGAIGALLSVIGRTGKQTFDCSAGRALHYLEGASRIWAGAISGILVGLAVRSGLMLSALSQGDKMPAVMLLAAFAAGTGERLVSSLMSTVGATGTRAIKPMPAEGSGDH